MQLNIAIVEDDPADLEGLRSCLTRFAEKEELTLQLNHFSDAADFLRQYQPVYHVVFMDIMMPKLNGMTAAERLRALDPVVPLVFVTNMVQFAVKGYEVNALDFLVKPIRYPSFQMKMRRILQAIQMNQHQGIVLPIDGAKRVIRTTDLYYIEVYNHYLTYHTAEGDFDLRGNLGSAEKALDADTFFRCSSSHIINLRYVQELRGEDVVVQGVPIRVSRTRKKELLTALTAYLHLGGG